MLQYCQPLFLTKERRKTGLRQLNRRNEEKMDIIQGKNRGQTEQYLKINWAFLYFIFISLKEKPPSSMNSCSTPYFYPQNGFLRPDNSHILNNSLLDVLSKALSRSLGEYCAARKQETKEIKPREVIEIIDSGNQDENIMEEEKEVVCSFKNISEENEKNTLKKDESSNQNGEKEQSDTIIGETLSKTLSAVKNQKQLFPQFELTSCNLDATEIFPYNITRQEIESKRSNLLRRKVELNGNNSKKMKYHGLGSQRRELKLLS